MSWRATARAVLCLMCAMLATAAAIPVQAGNAPQESPAFSTQREDTVLAFVREHHAELLPVLERLVKVDRQQYEQAVRELYLVTQQLAVAKANDEAFYELMLENWQLSSRIDVTAAQLALKPSDALQAELKALLYRKVDQERRMIEYRCDKLREMLKVAEANLERMTEQRETLVERRLRILSKNKPKGAAQPSGSSSKSQNTSPVVNQR